MEVYGIFKFLLADTLTGLVIKADKQIVVDWEGAGHSAKQG